MLKGKSNQSLNASCACATEQGIWFVYHDRPFLMFYDFKERRVTSATLIPCEDTSDYSYFFYGVIEYANDKLFLLASQVKTSFVYNIKNGEFTKIDFKKPIEEYCFFGAWSDNEYIYALSRKGNCLVKINAQNEKADYIPYNMDVPVLESMHYAKDKGMVCVSLSMNGLLYYDNKRMCLRQVDIREGKHSFCAAAFLNGSFYAYDMASKKVIRFDEKGSIDNSSKAFEIKEYAEMLCTHDGRIILEDVATGKIYFLNEELEVIEVIKIDARKSVLNSEWLQACWISGGKKTYGITKSNELITLKDGKTERLKLVMDDDLWDKLVGKYFKKKIIDRHFVLHENEFLKLDDFIHCL